jgi:Family of unknown function (DUF6650)
MQFREVVSRVTGLSVPIFGVQWNPPEAECVAARRVLAFLEDRRVLYVPSEMELPHHCVESVLRIREFLTTEFGKLNSEQELAQSLPRNACRLSEVPRHGSGRRPPHHSVWSPPMSLCELGVQRCGRRASWRVRDTCRKARRLTRPRR